MTGEKPDNSAENSAGSPPPEAPPEKIEDRQAEPKAAAHEEPKVSNDDHAGSLEKKAVAGNSSEKASALVAVLGKPLMIGYKRENGSYKWFAFDNAARVWKCSGRPSDGADFTQAISSGNSDFITQFVREAYAGSSVEKIRKIFPLPVSSTEVLLRKQFVDESDIDASDIKIMRQLLDKEKLAIRPEQIISVLESARQEKQKAKEKEAAKKRRNTEEASQTDGDRPYMDSSLAQEEMINDHIADAKENQKIAMRHAKVANGAFISLIGASIGIGVNRSMSKKKEAGERVTAMDRLIQVGVWSATAAAVIYAASAMWKGKKVNLPQR